MKYIIAATVLSCFVINYAEAKAPDASYPAIRDSVQSLSNVGYPIEIHDVEGALPALPVKEQEEPGEKEGKEDPQSIDTRENTYSSAGLTYNEKVDLPVFAQRKQLEGEDLPAVPQVVSCRTDGQVAITYSEGPSDVTARIARQLNSAQTRGSFFVNTKWLQEQQYATVLQNIYNAGHLIGLTYRLPTEDPETMSVEEIKADIIMNAHMVESLIHVAPKYVRLHLSARRDGRTEYILQELGFVLVGYNLDAKDYVHKTPELIEDEYRHTFNKYKVAHENKKGSFVAIQYDIPETGSMAAATNVIQLLKKEGYDAVRMDSCLNDYTPYKASAAGLKYVGDKFSLGTTGYSKTGQKIAAIIGSTAKEEMRGDEFVNQSASLVTVPAKMGYALIFALAYALIGLL